MERLTSLVTDFNKEISQFELYHQQSGQISNVVDLCVKYYSKIQAMLPSIKLAISDQISFYKIHLPVIVKHQIISHFLLKYYQSVPFGGKTERLHHIKTYQQALAAHFKKTLI
jgi:hypothetical protein